MALAFKQQPKVNVVEIGNEITGSLYLKKIWTRTGKESQACQKLDDNQMQTELQILKLARQISQAKGVSGEEVLAKIIRQDIGGYMIDFVEQIEALQALRENDRLYRDEIVTLFINGRLAYPITVTSAEEGENEIKCESLSFAIDVELTPKLINKNVPLSIKDSVAEYALSIPLTKPLLKTIKPGTVLFLADSQGRYYFGDPNWTLEDTQTNEQFKDSLKEEIFNFYQLEVAGLDAPKNEQTPPELKSPSEQLSNTSASLQSNGENFTSKLPATV